MTISVEPTWHPHAVLLSLVPLLSGWMIGLEMADEVTNLIRKAKYEETVRPMYLMILHTVILIVNLVAGFVVAHLTQESDELHELDISAGLLVLAMVLPFPLVLLGIFVYHIPASMNAGSGLKYHASRHKYTVVSSFLMAGGVSVMYAISAAGITYRAASVSVVPGVLLLGVLVMWSVVFAAQAVLLHAPAKFRLPGACGVSMCGTLVVMFIAREATEIETEQVFPVGHHDALWHAYFYVTIFISISAVVNSAGLMVTSLFSNPALQNSYCLGLTLGLVLGLGVNIDSSNFGEAVAVSLCLTFIISYTVLLSGIGDKISYGIATGFPYGSVISFNEGGPWMQFGVGIGLSVLMVVALQVSIVVTLRVYDMAFKQHQRAKKVQ